MGGLQGAASGRVHLGSKQLGLSQASGSFAGSIDGQGGQLDVLGGHETLSGGNTYTGQTGIAQGASLSLSGQGSITDSSHVNDAGLLDIGHCAKGASIRSLDGVASGRVQLGSKDLSLSQAHGHFAGSIEGQGGLKLEAGQETLSGVNGYTGATTIDRGATLALQGKGSIAEPGKLHDDGTLEFDQVHDTWNPSIQGKGGLGVRHWFRAPPSSLTMAFNAIPGAPFTTAGVTTPVNVVEAGAGVHAQLSRNLSAAVSYQGDYGRGLRSNDVQLHLAWRF